jgi:hypothetical protein
MDRGLDPQALSRARTVADFDADEVECPACGARFAPTSSRCPECDLNFGG